ncbi:NDP-hexose 2,3-dehydratase family protein [Streptomyces sp. B21-083]|uniref:NDP-hexose 2,3-dehydratase family protein n=1 Tax=Streptomyces sp. B21-083 TaxID=3039410 RepID=UPI002FF3356E
MTARTAAVFLDDGTAPDRGLRPRHDIDLPHRIALSAATRQGVGPHTEDVRAWLDERRRSHRFKVERIPFARLDNWSFDEGTGNLGHDSGRFFTVEGLRVVTSEGPHQEWHQPIIKQPEVGILGILAKEFDGVLHFLMQAKMEPGNPNLVQLSPTVQATRSNYTKVHKGGAVKYLEHFTHPDPDGIVADVLQSEHGSWFFRKSNRNMIVETSEEIPPDDDFCWLTLGQIGELLHADNVVNMDSRTVLSCAPYPDDQPGALHSDTELLSWFTVERSRHDIHSELLPLAGLPGWNRSESSIDHAEGLYFSVVAVRVQAESREVAGWTQPLFAPRGTGITAFLVRRFGGVPHVLVHARVEGGFLDTVELGPTVQCTPAVHAHLPSMDRPPFLDYVLDAPRSTPSRIRYEAVHSEEGGRFLKAESRYFIIEADEASAPLVPPSGYRWVTPEQLTSLVRHNHYVNVQARTLLACLNASGIRG